MEQDKVKELCHSAIKNYDNNTTLYHSDTYLGEDYSDGIKHWKYISKEKVNGKWRYYYNKVLDAFGQDEKEQFVKDATNYIEAEDAFLKEKIKRKQSGQTGNYYSNSYAQAHVYRDEMKEKAEKSRDAFKKTPLGKIKQLEINIKLTSNRIKGQIEKGKKILSKLFKK